MRNLQGPDAQRIAIRRSRRPGNISMSRPSGKRGDERSGCVAALADEGTAVDASRRRMTLRRARRFRRPAQNRAVMVAEAEKSGWRRHGLAALQA